MMQDSVKNGVGMDEKIAILDAGAQYGKVIDRKVRELNVLTEMRPLETPVSTLMDDGFKGVIISGGPGSVYHENAPKCDAALFSCGLPVLGICYGMQLINFEMGGSVERKDAREDGVFSIEIDSSCKIFKGLSSKEEVLLTHGDSLQKVAPGFKTVASSGDLIAGIANQDKKLYGVQFHPEVDLTVSGKSILRNFLYDVCGLSGTFKMTCRVESCLKEIKDTVGNSKVLMLLSGGVDSTVCAALLRKALPADQIVAIHIDNGFMRRLESDAVCQSLDRMGIKVQLVRAAQRFMAATTSHQIFINGEARNIKVGPLNNITHPEEKRKIIGDTFIAVSEETLEELNLKPEEVLLGQGTLRPDLIESASSLVSAKADAIKTHHNDTELVRRLRAAGRVVEPLRDFHKDEVRVIGRQIGLPEEIVQRHPFPGPGLAIRILCAIEPYMDRLWSETCSTIKIIAGYHKMCETPHGLLNKIKLVASAEEQRRLIQITREQTLNAILLPVQSVGVQGDCRTYNYCCALSTKWEPNWKSLLFLAKLIPRICHNINRVVYVFGDYVAHPVLDVTVTHLKQMVIATLREADHQANQVLREKSALNKVTQMPVVLLPIHFDRDPSSIFPEPSVLRSVVLRPFLTHDFMTGKPAVPGEDISIDVVCAMVDAVKRVPGISRVLYDLTSKPPGTTEWE